MMATQRLQKMMAKKSAIPATRRMQTTMCISVPVCVREQVEDEALKTNVSYSEVGRLAFEAYFSGRKQA